MNYRAGLGTAALLAATVLTAGCGRDEPPPPVATPTTPPAADTTTTTTTTITTPDVRQEAQQAANSAERGLEKAGAALDDASITAKVKTALIAEPALSGMAVDVDTSANVVSLNGAVATASAKSRAEEIARKTEGVKEVRNNLTVKPAS